MRAGGRRARHHGRCTARVARMDLCRTTVHENRAAARQGDTWSIQLPQCGSTRAACKTGSRSETEKDELCCGRQPRNPGIDVVLVGTSRALVAITRSQISALCGRGRPK